MQHQRTIALQAPQRASITAAIQSLQANVVDLEWDMQAEGQKLTELLNGPTIDEDAALAQVDRVLDIERQVKKAHLGLLIQIKNTLTAEQQAKLRRLQDSKRAITWTAS